MKEWSHKHCSIFITVIWNITGTSCISQLTVSHTLFLFLPFYLTSLLYMYIIWWLLYFLFPSHNGKYQCRIAIELKRTGIKLKSSLEAYSVTDRDFRLSSLEIRLNILNCLWEGKKEAEVNIGNKFLMRKCPDKNLQSLVHSRNLKNIKMTRVKSVRRGD